MVSSKLFFFLFTASFSVASPKRPSVPKPDADGKYTLEADGIRAQVRARFYNQKHRPAPH